MAKSANLTKFDAGGTGDNITADGFIKTVEKVWIDTYTYSSSSTIGTGLIIEIAQIPENKKITGIDVYGLGALSATSTNAVSIGTKIANGTTHATLFLAATTYGTGPLKQVNKCSADTNIPYTLTGGVNRLFLLFTAASPSVTGGTITTVVRYT